MPASCTCMRERDEACLDSWGVWNSNIYSRSSEERKGHVHVECKFERFETYSWEAAWRARRFARMLGRGGLRGSYLVGLGYLEVSRGSSVGFRSHECQKFHLMSSPFSSDGGGKRQNEDQPNASRKGIAPRRGASRSLTLSADLVRAHEQAMRREGGGFRTTALHGGRKINRVSDVRISGSQPGSASEGLISRRASSEKRRGGTQHNAFTFTGGRTRK